MKNLKLVLLVLSLLFSCKVISAQTAEQNFYKGLDYYNAGNYTEAVKWYRKAANQGYALAQHNLGCCYVEGNGVKQNYTEAVKWFRKAANQGNARAQYNLGVCYAEGNGVKQNYTEAVKWYRKAAEQGFDMAQYELGNCYYSGNGVVKNYPEAVKWLLKAAEQGNGKAQSELAACYEHGKGVVKNDAEAVRWLHKAAEHEDESVSQFNLGMRYYDGKGVTQSYIEADKWLRKAMKGGGILAFSIASLLADPDFEAGLEAEKNKIQSSSSSTSSTISSSSSSTTYTPIKYITDKFDITVEFGGGLGVTEDYDYAIGHNIHLNVFGLYNFNENFLLGLGTGFRGFSVSETYDYINEWDMRGFDISIPIYLRAQYTFADKWSFRRPFVSCDFGWMFPISDEYFSYEKYLIEPHIGIKYDNQITFSLGCTILNATYPWEYDNESKTICSISAKLGVVF